MPNNIKNRIKIIAPTQADVDAVLSAIKGENFYYTGKQEVIDFETICPMPKGQMDVIPWRNANWNTKWNAYKSEVKNGNEVWFETAWSAVTPLVGLLSQQFPDHIFEYTFSDEDAGYNVGKRTIERGELEKAYTPHGGSKDAYDIYFELHPDKRKYYTFDEATQSYNYKDIEE